MVFGLIKQCGSVAMLICKGTEAVYEKILNRNDVYKINSKFKRMSIRFETKVERETDEREPRSSDLVDYLF